MMRNRVLVRPADRESDFAAAAGLMRQFLAWHRARHTQDLDLIDRYFDEAAYEEELAHLRTRYAPPWNALLVAEDEGRIIGCVALKKIDEKDCEMKRMFLDESCHGRGIGRALGKAIVEQAREAGYSRMLLDTSIRQDEAQGLYRSLGFRQIPPYYELPKEVEDWLVFMELPLQ